MSDAAVSVMQSVYVEKGKRVCEKNETKGKIRRGEEKRERRGRGCRVRGTNREEWSHGIAQHTLKEVPHRALVGRVREHVPPLSRHQLELLDNRRSGAAVVEAEPGRGRRGRG
jgi:hypothetical protein